MVKQASPKGNRKQSNAKALYITAQYQQQEIAELIGVTPQTISRWVKAGQWDLELANITITKEKQLSRFYMQLNELNEHIASREKGERYASSSESDTLNKLATAIQKLETEVGVSDIISVSIGILEFCRAIDLDKSKEISDLFDAYIKSKMK